jgi:hypothetical protein
MRPASIPAFRPDPIDTGGVLLIHYALKHWNAPTSFSAAGRLTTVQYDDGGLGGSHAGDAIPVNAAGTRSGL